MNSAKDNLSNSAWHPVNLTFRGGSILISSDSLKPAFFTSAETELEESVTFIPDIL